MNRAALIDNKDLELNPVQELTTQSLKPLDNEINKVDLKNLINNPVFQKSDLLVYFKNEELLKLLINRGWFRYNAEILDGKHSRTAKFNLKCYIEDFEKAPGILNFVKENTQAQNIRTQQKKKSKKGPNEPKSFNKLRFLRELDTKTITKSTLLNYFSSNELFEALKDRSVLDFTPKKYNVSGLIHENIINSFEATFHLSEFEGQSELLNLLISKSVAEFFRNTFCEHATQYFSNKVTGIPSPFRHQPTFSDQSGLVTPVSETTNFISDTVEKQLCSLNNGEITIPDSLQVLNKFYTKDEVSIKLLDHAHRVYLMSDSERIDTLIKRDQSENKVFNEGDTVSFILKDVKNRKHFFTSGLKIKEINMSLELPKAKLAFLSSIKPELEEANESKSPEEFRTFSTITREDDTVLYEVYDWVALDKLWLYNPLIDAFK